jgi:hypothetical protein
VTKSAPVYDYPPMPIEAVVFLDADQLPPTDAVAELLKCSISPIKPEDFLRGTEALSAYPVSHIIRTAPNPRIRDNLDFGSPQSVFPCAVFEYPPDSGRYYVTMWYHEVGVGFSNHHARVYVTRMAADVNGQRPGYSGWV